MSPWKFLEAMSSAGLWDLFPLVSCRLLSEDLRRAREKDPAAQQRTTMCCLSCSLSRRRYSCSSSDLTKAEEMKSGAVITLKSDKIHDFEEEETSLLVCRCTIERMEWRMEGGQTRGKRGSASKNRMLTLQQH